MAATAAEHTEQPPQKQKSPSVVSSGRTPPQSVVQSNPQSRIQKLSGDNNVQTGRVEITEGRKKTCSTNFGISFSAQPENSVKTGNF
jgi:hypothetical protein